MDGSPGQKAGLEAFFDFIVCIGNTRLVSVMFLSSSFVSLELIVFFRIKTMTH